MERKSKSKKAAFERCFFCAGTDIQIFRKIEKAPNKKISTNKVKVKSLVHLFKGGGSPEGGAIWSLSADSEILLRVVKAIKLIADKYKGPKAACTENSKPCM